MCGLWGGGETGGGGQGRRGGAPLPPRAAGLLPPPPRRPLRCGPSAYPTRCERRASRWATPPSPSPTAADGDGPAARAVAAAAAAAAARASRGGAPCPPLPTPPAGRPAGVVAAGTAAPPTPPCASPPFPLGPWRRGARWPCPPARAAAAGGTTAAAAVAAGRRDWPPVAQTVDGRRWGVGIVGGGVAEAAPVWGGGGVWGLLSFRTRRGGDARASASVSPRWRQQRRRALLRCHSLNDGGTPCPPSRPAPPRPRTTNARGRDDGHGMRARRGADPSRGVDVVDADTEAPRVVLHGPHGGWPMGVGGGPPRGK